MRTHPHVPVASSTCIICRPGVLAQLITLPEHLNPPVGFNHLTLASWALMLWWKVGWTWRCVMTDSRFDLMLVLWQIVRWTWRVCYCAEEVEPDSHVIVQKSLNLMRLWFCIESKTWRMCDGVYEVEPDAHVIVQRRLNLMLMWLWKGCRTWLVCYGTQEL